MHMCFSHNVRRLVYELGTYHPLPVDYQAPSSLIQLLLGRCLLNSTMIVHLDTVQILAPPYRGPGPSQVCPATCDSWT